MPLPANWSTVTVTGQFLTIDGDPFTGNISFSSTVRLVDAAEAVIVPASVVTATLDGTGSFSVLLGATDDPQVAPVFFYEVHEQLLHPGLPATTGAERTARQRNAKYLIQLPAASPTVDLANLAPATDVAEVSPFARLAVRNVFTKPQVINAASGSDTGYPLGRAGAVETGLSVPSSFVGGEDSGSGTDTTGRVNLYSFQRAQTGSFGETVRHFLMRGNAKAMTAWYMPKAGYNPDKTPDTSQGWSPVWWVGAHWESNDGLSIHGHGSIEVPDATGALQTRLEIPFIDQTAPPAQGAQIGVATCNIRTNLADLTVRASTGVLRIGSSTTFNKDLLFSISSDRDPTGERWKIRCNTDAESTGNAGSNFVIRRHSDNGSVLGTALGIERATGNVTIGGDPAASAGRVHIVQPTNKHGVVVVPTAQPGNNAAYATQMTAATDRLLDSRVAADGNARYAVFTDGLTEWGDGTLGRDTNLFRDAADRLRTNDSLRIDARLGVGQIPDANATIGVTQAADQQSLYLINTLVAGNTNQPHIRADSATATSLLWGSRVTGDAVTRFLSRIDGQIQWGDGAGARDTNLYRSAADTLKTDDSFHVGATLRHLGASLGFYNAAAVAKPAVTGSRGGNAALASALTALANLGLITDSSTA